jgi:MATE family multidrug resistance protein
MSISNSVSQAQIGKTFPCELRLTAALGGPLALGELGWMSTYIVDALMIGRLPHSALSISASSLGNTIFYTVVFCVIKLLTGLNTLVAQAYGRGDQEDCTRNLMQSFWFVFFGTPLVMLLTLAAVPILAHVGTPADIRAETGRYLHALVWSTAPLLLYMALRQYLQSLDRVVLIMVSLVTASVVNFVGDWAFLYGHLGLHPMGIAGSGWSTCVVRLYTLGLVLVATAISFKSNKQKITWALLWPDLRRLGAMMRIGWPAALESLTDLGVSMYMSILCSRLGSQLLAAHQVVLDLDAFVYMVPLGLSYATIVRVGQSAGRASLVQVRRSANASLLLGMGYITLAALAFAGFPHTWGSLYSNDPAVVEAAAPIFLICGVLQLGDAAGVILGGALTGIGDTRTPFLVNSIWYWFLGMPLSYWLTFGNNLSLRGLWIGRAVAALGSAGTLAYLWKARMNRMSGASRARRPALLAVLQAK